jgi:hypothetical protein
MLAKWLVEDLGSGSIADYYDLPERYLWAKIAVAAGASRPEADYVSLPKNYAWSDIYNAVAGSSGNHTDWTEKQALGHIAAAYRGDTGTPENLATYIDWPWRYQVASIVIHPRIDADALAYIQSVETADGATLESGVRVAIDNFVRGCKTDGIWSAIKSSAILAGARTLSGALQPLVGAAPTNFNFVSGDYNRKTGLVGNGSSKYLNSNRANNADPQNSKHMSVYASSNTTASRAYMGAGGAATGRSSFGPSSTSTTSFAVINSTASYSCGATNVGFMGMSRASSTQFTARGAGSTLLHSDAPAASGTPTSGALYVLARENNSGVAELYSDARLAFYSIGESLDLALLDARVTNLINAYAAQIP